MEGLGFGWAYFNHRLSVLDLGVDDAGAFGAVVGGTSTTGAVPSLPAGCDPDACEEFPFLDESDAWVDRVVLATRARAATGTVAWATGAAEVPATVRISLPGARSPVALLTGLRFDTSGPALDCYDPGFGWHPRRIMLRIDAVAVDGDDVEVDLAASFEPGPSEEAVRACIDAVVGDAVVSVRADVLVVDASADTQDVVAEAAYAFDGDSLDPDPQPDPDPQAVSFDEHALLGWTRLDWRFHEGGTRGAYLRTLSASASPDAAVATATNFSPGTQLSDFDFRFEGSVAALDLDGEVARQRWEGRLPAELDPDGHAVLHRLTGR
jgi:hypothetical protein